MKQRVGIARALARGPELLCMDEPCSALDVFTAESLRTEIYRMWSGGQSKLPFQPKSVVIITHNIEEAVFLADRIVVLGTRPGRIRTVIQNDVPHPREYQSPPFLRMVQRLHDVITKEQMRMFRRSMPRPSRCRAVFRKLFPFPRSTWATSSASWKSSAITGGRWTYSSSIN